MSRTTRWGTARISVFLALILFAVHADATTPALATIPGNAKVALPAATATLMVTFTIQAAVSIQNRDAASIFCGTSAAVTNTNGIEIVAGGSKSISAVTVSATLPLFIYCYSVAGQVSPADTRLLGVR